MVTPATRRQPYIPDWAGAAEVYAKAFALLDVMTANGHVTTRRNALGLVTASVPSDAMQTILSAMDNGNETGLKAALSNAYAEGWHLRRAA